MARILGPLKMIASRADIVRLYRATMLSVPPLGLVNGLCYRKVEMGEFILFLTNCKNMKYDL